jgi:hypothetical protein
VASRRPEIAPLGTALPVRGGKEQQMELTFELGFDWNSPAVQGVRDGVYPLQVFLVDDRENSVISPCNPAQVGLNAKLGFRVYDFTDPRAGSPGGAAPATLQVLFTRATSLGDPPFSPILRNGAPVAQLTSTSFASPARDSIAFGAAAVAGWDVKWPDGDVRLDQGGRFKFRALLTVSVPGEMARFYRVDPEMVIGDGGP